MSNFYRRFARRFDEVSDRVCLRVPGGSDWTFAEMSERIASFAAVLAECAMQPGERLLAQIEKSPDALALYLACLQRGVAFVPINTAYTEREVQYFIDDADPGVFVCRPEHAPDAGNDSPRCRVLTLGADGEGTWCERAAGLAPLNDVVSCAPDSVAAILYTSGTTGRSKGAMLTHANLESNAYALSEAWGWREDDVLLHALPVFHVHGLFIAMHCSLLGASATIFLPRFDASAVIEQLPNATVLMGVPTFYTRLLAADTFTHESCANVRVFISGSAPLTTQTFETFERRTGMRILERYGMSETIINTSNPLDGARVAGTVGYPLPGVEVRVCDELGAERARGDVGVIEVRGPNVFAGYWRMPEKTAEEIRPDGFFITGDLGTQDADGRLTIVGRSKDLVISGGYNVYPKEVEAVLDSLDAITESAVIGVPHDDFGEAVVAVVVPAHDDVELTDLREVLDAALARFKHPKAVMNVSELPRNAMGKVQKNTLRDRYCELFQTAGRNAAQ